MNPQKPISQQEEHFDDIASECLKIWTRSMGGILMIPDSQQPSGNALVGLHQEIKRLMRKYIQMTPSDFGDAIRNAHRKELESDFPRVTILKVENELNEIGMSKRVEKALPAHIRWQGDPSKCLDDNWDEIWAKSVEKSIEKGDKARMFDWEYLDTSDESTKRQYMVRLSAYSEMISRVMNDPRYDYGRVQRLVRIEMALLLLAAYPKYKGDIERAVFSVQYEDLDKLAAEIKGKSDGHFGKFMPMPCRINCERSVAFDMYAEFKGLQWPKFPEKPRPKSDSQPTPMPRTKIPKSLDDIEV